MKTDPRESIVTHDRQRRGTGIGGAAALCCALAVAAFGCASMNQKCSFYPDGILESYRQRSTVVGTGETEVVTTDCAALAYSTRDTGLSDNGKAALGEIAKGAVSALAPEMSALGVVEDLRERVTEALDDGVSSVP